MSVLAPDDARPATLLAGHASLLAELAEVLSSHPSGGAVKLLIAPEALRVAADEVVIQVVDAQSNTAQLRVCKISEVAALADAETLHDMAVVDPSDESLVEYAKAPHPGWFYAITKTGHS